MAEAITRRSTDLRRAVDRDEEDLEQALSELKHVSKERLQLSHYMTHQPRRWVLVAAGLGWVMGARAARRR
jgi:hypothetical protein